MGQRDSGGGGDGAAATAAVAELPCPLSCKFSTVLLTAFQKLRTKGNINRLNLAGSLQILAPNSSLYEVNTQAKRTPETKLTIP